MVRRRWWEEPEQIKRWKIFRGDRVEVLRGPGRGKRGVVLRRLMAENKLVVQGINVHEQTGEKKVVKREAPIWYHDVNIVDPTDGYRTRVKWGFLASGERVRVAKRSGAVVPRVPHQAKYTPEERMERPQYQGNTPREAVTAASYEPPALLQERRAARLEAAAAAAAAADADAAGARRVGLRRGAVGGDPAEGAADQVGSEGRRGVRAEADREHARARRGGRRVRAARTARSTVRNFRTA